AVVWRSPIVSIAVSVLFWVACFVIGSVHSVAENMLLSKDRLVKVFWAGESLIGIDELGWGYAWQAESREWKDVFVMPDQRQARPFLLLQPTVPRAFRAVGPVYDAEHDRLLAAVPTFPPSTVRLAVGQRAEQWQPASNLAAPTGTLALLREPRGSILLASSLGLSRLTGNPLAERQSLTLFGLNLPLPGGGPFQSVNPEPAVLLTPPADVALDPQTGAVIVYTRGVLHRLVLETPRAGLASVAAGTPQFVRSAEYRLDGSERQAAVVAMGAQHVAVGREDGRVQILDAATLTPREEFRPEGPNAPRFLDVSPDGRWFSIVFHTGRLWLYDTMDNRLVRADVTGQGDISAASFTTEGKLLVVDRLQRVSEYTLDSLALQRRFEPRPGLVLSVYRYVVVPLYTVFPKPGELDKTFQYLLSGQTTAQVDEEGDDLTTARWNMDPWIPVWSSAAFTLAVLLVACGYIEYQDF
ncbi:MAG: WD40 repeat domain-containing protein, partial [Pirellulaceae bacterium]